MEQEITIHIADSIQIKIQGGTIHIDEIIPMGNLEIILTRFKDRTDMAIENYKNGDPTEFGEFKNICNDLVKKNQIQSILVKGILQNNIWNKHEAIICLLFIQLLVYNMTSIVRKRTINDQEYSRIKELQKHIDENKHIYGKLIIIE